MELSVEGRYNGGRRKRTSPVPVAPPRVPTPRPLTNNSLKLVEGVVDRGQKIGMQILTSRSGSFDSRDEDSREWLSPRILSKIEESSDNGWLYSRLETRLTLSGNGNASAAAAFFARATQKLSLSSGGGSGGSGGSPHRRKRVTGGWPGAGGSAAPQVPPPDDDPAGFCLALIKHPPPLPSALLRRLGTKELSGVGKVRVMLKVCEGLLESSVLSVDAKRRQVTLFDPAACGAAGAAASLTPEDRRLGVAAPKMFAFDAIFSHQDPQTEVCGSALTDLIHAVITGTDGCLFCYGHPRLGKTATMIGSPESGSTLGVIPSAISWLFRCIAEQKQKSGTRFSVRVSALEVSSQTLKDLLSHHAAENDQSPGIYLCEGGAQSYCELRAPTAEKAAYYLDAALATRSAEQSHLFYTLHIYQYNVAGKGGVAGGRSRLHLIDLGNCERGKAGGGLPLSGIGNVLLSIFNGQKHLPHKDHKLTQQLKECLGSLTCHAAMIAHVSPHAANYTDTLTTIQLASRIHRMRRRKFKFMGNNGAIAGEDANRLTGSSDVDPSSSEQSADTVIYVGPTEETDGEHPPVYIPSLNSGDNRCAMGKALKGSAVDQKLKATSKSVPASPQKQAATDEKLAAAYGRKPPKPNSTKSSPARTPKPVPREEQWVDGPRIPKSRVTEGRNIHLGRDKKETWVDGPRMSNGHSGSGYGFMDYHKKTMIRKWVENQSIHIGKSKHFKEMTVFKTFDEARGRGSGQEDEGPSSASQISAPIHPINQDLMPVPLQRLPCSGIEAEDEIDEEEDMEVEIIEVEEPIETVPMQDCCLQVTEEDIALCMGELENPLPEVDQEEHPLRLLSQENLTVVSTFTDSLSIANDLERIFPRNSSFINQVNGWPYHKEAAKEILSNKLSQYEQLSKLHELYSARTARPEMRPVSRCQSLMFSELIAEVPNDFDTNSIASEPAYLPGERSKLCDNCKINLENKSDITALLYKHDTRYQAYHQLTRSISSLRHPDGASNPNLGESCKREPGNGAEGFREMLRRPEPEEDISVPPPLLTNLLTLNREGFDSMKTRSQDNSEITNGLVHDPGGKGKLSRPNIEKTDRGWCIKNTLRLQNSKVNQVAPVKPDTGTGKHRLLFPFGHGGLLSRRSNFQANMSSRSTNPPQAS